MENLSNNHYLLANFMEALTPQIRHTKLIEVYSQNPREYVFQLAHNNDHVSLTFFSGGQDSFLFAGKKSKPKHGAHLYFRELMGKEVQDAGVFENDRSCYITFEDRYQLVYKLYGQHANVILLFDGAPHVMLRQNFKRDWQKQFSDYHQPIEQTYSAYENLLEEYGDPEKALKSLFPAFPRAAFDYLEERGLYQANPTTQWQYTQDLLQYFKCPKYFIGYQEVKNKNNPGYYSTIFEVNEPVQQLDNALDAYQEFARVYLKHFNILLYKNELLDHFRKKVNQFNKKIKNNEKRLQKLVEGYGYKTLADVIMANLHLLEKGQDEAELYDFYNDATIQIPLKRELSPQKNAERYYRKGRNQYYEMEQLESQIEQDRQEHASLQEQLEQIEGMEDLKTLQKEYKAVFDKSGKKQDRETAPPFKHFKVKGYDVYAGKGAKSNDALTFKFANKNDLWLHARDRHGSHVVVRNPGVQEFPQEIIESAASIAAYYSKGKGEAMCAVVYTRKKYVWKPKGSDPGQVHYKHEEVVLAEPGIEVT